MKQYTRKDWEKAKAALDAARKAEMAIRDQIEERELKPKLRAMVGKCFKYRNSYSCPQKPSDYWWEWHLVTGADGAVLSGVQLARDSRGEFRIRPSTMAAFDGKIGDGYIPVTRREYERAAKAILRQAAEKALPKGD